MAEQKTEGGGYILLVEDDLGVSELEAQRLEVLGLELRRAHTAAEARAALLAEAPRITLLDYSLPDADALALVDEIKKARGEMPPFLLVTGRGDEAVAVAAMKAGACDYVVKDGSFLERLPAVVLKCIKERELHARLAASEERFRQVFEAANVAKSITLPDGTITPNQALCDMLGYTSGELANKNWRELTPEEDIPATEKIVGELARGEKESARFEKRYLRKDGAVVWGDVSSKGKRDAAGRLEYFITTIVDITEHRRVQADYKVLFESMLDGFAVHEMIFNQAGKPADYRFLTINSAFANLTGMGILEMTGRLLSELMADGYEEWVEIYGKVVLTGEPARFERFSPQLGRYYDILAFKSGPRNFACIFRDITARKAAEEKLREQATLLHEEESRFRLLAESAPDGIFVQSGGKFSYLNAAACRLFGAAAPTELLGRPFLDRMAPEFHEAIKRRIAAQRKTGESAPLMEQEYLRLDGSRVSVETTAVPIKYLGADSHLVFVRDITLRKKMEEEVLKSQKIESLGVLAGGIAHDFNNMLMGVTANLTLLAAKNPPGAEILEDAISAARSAQSLSAQLLSFARGGQPVKKELCLERPLREIYGLSVSGSGIAQQLQVPEGLWSVNADENQVKQVVNNVLLNALQAMPSGGTLTLSAENLALPAGAGIPLEPGNYLKITVADTGIGIPEKYLRQLFDPYFTTKPKGHGLGLAMAWTVIKNHGGHIEVQSEPGKGSRFVIFLPATGRCLKEGQAGVNKIEKGSGRILLLEDEEIVVRVAKRMLAELGYTCEVVPEGGQALKRYGEEAAAGRPFDAVILDLTVPGGMGGKEAGALLRSRYPGAVLLVSSGYCEEPVMAAYKDFGFDAVLPKPYNYEALAEILASIVGKK
jgi:PAS domain S-box-containing protein